MNYLKNTFYLFSILAISINFQMSPNGDRATKPSNSPQTDNLEEYLKDSGVLNLNRNDLEKALKESGEFNFSKVLKNKTLNFNNSFPFSSNFRQDIKPYYLFLSKKAYREILEEQLASNDPESAAKTFIEALEVYLILDPLYIDKLVNIYRERNKLKDLADLLESLLEPDSSKYSPMSGIFYHSTTRNIFLFILYGTYLKLKEKEKAEATILRIKNFFKVEDNFREGDIFSCFTTLNNIKLKGWWPGLISLEDLFELTEKAAKNNCPPKIIDEMIKMATENFESRQKQKDINTDQEPYKDMSPEKELYPEEKFPYI